MGLFDTQAVKALRKETELIGSMHGQVFLGHLSQADLDDVLAHPETRARLRRAVDAAAADVGKEKALKIAVREIRMYAEAYGRLSNRNYGAMLQTAEEALRDVLAAPSVERSARPLLDAASGVGRPGEDLSRRYLAAAPPGNRAELLAVACVFDALMWPSAAKGRCGSVIEREELRTGAERVRVLMAQDRDLGPQIARKAVLQINHALEGGNLNSHATDVDPSLEMMLLALKEVGLTGAVERDGVNLRITEYSHPQEEDAVAAIRAARQALAVLRSALGQATPRERQFFVELYTGKDGTDVESASYRIVAWAAILNARLVNAGILHGYRPEYAKIVPLSAPGWYPNPGNTGPIVDGDATFKRYWDGQWTDRIRIQRDGRVLEQSNSLHEPPD